MKISLIISYYKNIANLDLILNALNEQSSNDFEVIISEDDNDWETKKYLTSKIKTCNFPVIHLKQDVDNGFRKNEMLNKSIIKAKYENVVFIDGDCIPHKHFIKEYIERMADGNIYFGRRVMLSEKHTAKLHQAKNNRLLGFCQLLINNSNKKKESLYFPFVSIMIKERGLVGCNWGIKKKHLIEVNGFDEDYTKAGYGEDSDIEWRLRKNGLKMKSMKNRSIVYHLHHPRTYSEEGLKFNYKLMVEKQTSNKIFCLNGVEKH